MRWFLARLLVIGMIIEAIVLQMLVINLARFRFVLFEEVPVVGVEDIFAPIFLFLMHCVIILFRYFIEC